MNALDTESLGPESVGATLGGEPDSAARRPIGWVLLALGSTLALAPWLLLLVIQFDTPFAQLAPGAAPRDSVDWVEFYRLPVGRLLGAILAAMWSLPCAYVALVGRMLARPRRARAAAEH